MFVLQRHKTHGQEEVAVLSQCILNRTPYKICGKFEEAPAGCIPVGSVEWCEQFLPKEVTIPDYYPEFLRDHLYRNVWKADKWPLGQKVFIKPADRHKRFTGFVTTGTYRKKKRGPYWCSDVVKFTNEWRYYVAGGRVLAAEWYAGDEVNTPPAPELGIDLPGDCYEALDFGTLSTGEFALVEANFPYACGWYGKDHKVFVEWLTRSWEFLTTKRGAL